MTQSLQHLIAAQKPSVDVIIHLYQLDATRCGLGQYYFTPGLVQGAPVVYQGIQYAPFPVAIAGLEVTSQGAQPRPKLSVSNIDLGGQGYAFLPLFAKQAGDLVGSYLTRIRVFEQHLDNGSNPDRGAHWPGQTFIVDRKSHADKTVLEWELANPLDQRHIKIPARLALKNSCAHNYRVWNGTFFDGTTATCPWHVEGGGPYFTNQDIPTTDPAKDSCSKHIKGCRLRFGAHAILPMEAFPGMRRI